MGAPFILLCVRASMRVHACMHVNVCVRACVAASFPESSCREKYTSHESASAYMYHSPIPRPLAQTENPGGNSGKQLLG